MAQKDYLKGTPEQILGRRSGERRGQDTIKYDPFLEEDSYDNVRAVALDVDIVSVDMRPVDVKSGWIKFLRDDSGFYLSPAMIKKIILDSETCQAALMAKEEPSPDTITLTLKFLKQLSKMLSG